MDSAFVQFFCLIFVSIDRVFRFECLDLKVNGQIVVKILLENCSVVAGLVKFYQNSRLVWKPEYFSCILLDP